MKLLINLCAHDGIISHYTGVGTMVKRYILSFIKILNNKNISYHINLITPAYNIDSFGYSKSTHDFHKRLKNTSIIEISNGSNGTINYGTPTHWKELCKNTADFINSIDSSSYDKILTIYNDTPFVTLSSYLNYNINHKKVWIPHSTIKIHEVDSAIPNSHELYNTRLDMEQSAIDYINQDNTSYLGGIGNFIIEHLTTEYHLNKDKVVRITNGELLDELLIPSSIEENINLFNKIKDYNQIVLSFGRAEEYKNLTSTFYLGKALNIPTVVITQSYYKEQPILKEYQELANKTNNHLFIDPPFNFAKYILHNFNKPIILVIPSKKEIMGLIINEIRKLNKDNILIVSNNIDGLKEQITDKYDGLLIDISNIESSKNKVLEFFNQEKMSFLNHNAQITLKTKYDFLKNSNDFINEMLGDTYE